MDLRHLDWILNQKGPISNFQLHIYTLKTDVKLRAETNIFFPLID